jgi:tight adherence protein B
MSAAPGNDFSLVVVVLVFLSGALLLEGLYLLWQSWQGTTTRKLSVRLRNLVKAVDLGMASRIEKQALLSKLPGFAHLLRIFPRLLNVEAWVLQSGVTWGVERFFSLSLLCSLLTMAGLALFSALPWIMTLAAGVMGACLPAYYLRRKRTQRLAKLAQQLPETLDFLARGIRAGHAFSNGLKMIAEKLPEPIAGEFRIVRDEISFGVSLEQALTNLTLRVPDANLNYFVIAVLINREMGGKLTEILENLSHLIRERQKFADKVKVLAAESQMTGWVLSLLPFVLAAILSVVNPKFMAPLWEDPVGVTIIQYGLLLMVFGIVILRKIVRIRV